MTDLKKLLKDLKKVNTHVTTCAVVLLLSAALVGATSAIVNTFTYSEVFDQVVSVLAAFTGILGGACLVVSVMLGWHAFTTKK